MTYSTVVEAMRQRRLNPTSKLLKTAERAKLRKFINENVRPVFENGGISAVEAGVTTRMLGAYAGVSHKTARVWVKIDFPAISEWLSVGSYRSAATTARCDFVAEMREFRSKLGLAIRDAAYRGKDARKAAETAAMAWASTRASELPREPVTKLIKRDPVGGSCKPREREAFRQYVREVVLPIYEADPDETALQVGVTTQAIADVVGVHPATISVWMRCDFPEIAAWTRASTFASQETSERGAWLTAVRELRGPIGEVVGRLAKVADQQERERLAGELSEVISETSATPRAAPTRTRAR